MSRILLVLLFCALASVSQADLIQNGSFEPPDTPGAPPASYSNYGENSTEITGWTVVGASGVSVISNTFQSQGITFNAQNGTQSLDLTALGNSKDSGVSQTVTTSIGQSYLLKFWVGSASDLTYFFPATVDLTINNGSRISFTNLATTSGQMNWQQFSHTFVASGPTTTFTFLNGSENNNHHTGLDNVTLSAASGPSSVPEPTTICLIATATGICCIRNRRKWKRK